MKKRKTSPFSRVISNTFIMTIGRVINALCSFIFIPWTTASIGITHFGQLVLLIAFISSSAKITSLQAGQTLIQYGSAPFHRQDEHNFRQILAFCIRLECISGIIGMFAGWLGIMFFGKFVFKEQLELYSLAYYCLILIPFTNATWQIGLIQLLNKHYLFVPIQVLSTTVRTLGCFIGYEEHLSMPYFLAVWCTTQLTDFIVLTIIGIYLTRNQSNISFLWKTLFSPSTPVKGIWHFTFFTTINNFIFSCSGQIFTLIVSALVSAADLAILSVARQIVSAVFRLSSLMGSNLYPELTKLRDDKNWHTLRRTLLKTFCFLGSLAVILLLITSILGQYFLSFMLSHPAPAGCITLLNILAVAYIIAMASIPLNLLLTIFNNLSYITKVKSFIFVTWCIPLLLWLTHAFGINGAAIADACEEFAIFLLYIYKVTRIINSLPIHH